MNDILVIMMLWLGANTPYNTSISMPNIIQTEQANLCRNYGMYSHNQCNTAQLVAFYNKSYTIYLNQNFNHHQVVDQGRLMHELVHYVQWANGKNKTTCLGHLEVEAYEIQDQWRAKHSLASSLDPFKKSCLKHHVMTNHMLF
jgi:hypothetical protein